LVANCVRNDVLHRTTLHHVGIGAPCHGQSFLSSYRPDVICEVLAGVASGEELEELLPPGYSSYLICEDALTPRPRIEPSARFRDWFLTPRGRDELVALGIPIVDDRGG
jgi:hypothetical protein